MGGGGWGTFRSQLFQKRRKNPPPRTNKNVLDVLQMKIIHPLFPVPQLVVYNEDISRLGCVTTIVQASGFLVFVKSKKKMSPPEIDAAAGVTIDFS